MLTRLLRRMVKSSTQENFESGHNETPLSASLKENIAYLQNAYGNSSDLNIRKLKSGNVTMASVVLDNMIDKDLFSKMLLEKILLCKNLPRQPEKCFAQIKQHLSASPDQKTAHTFDQLYVLLSSGFGILFVDGSDKALALGVQKYPVRSVQSPENEVMERGAHEAFVEVLKQNITMLRRRFKTPDLRIDDLQVGAKSKTAVAVCYLHGTASPKMVAQIKEKLKQIQIDTVLESGYLQPFLEDNALSLFSSVGVSERPDTVCGKMAEGRVAVLVDGTPFCLITPFLFAEHFQSLDDYTVNPFFASFIRLLKYLSFFLAILLPGLYVAIGEHNPEVFPSAIFFKVVDAEVSTPFSLLWEALIIHTIYEIMREAGLRLPKSVGHAVSIVGALVIGEAAVTAGLIGAPMIIVVAVTALASYVIPSLYYPAALLRLLFIVVGGIAGLFGVVLLLALVILEITSLEPFGIPISAPFSPFDFSAMRDTLIRAGWKTLSKRTMKVQNLHGGEEDEA